MKKMKKKFQKKNMRINRREALKLGSMATAGAMGLPYFSNVAHAAGNEKKFLFVFAGAGGSSLIDSFLASNTGPAAFAAAELAQVNGSAFTGVLPLDNSIVGAINLGNGFSQQTFLSKHTADTAVITSEVSSVNHVIAARRAVTGDNISGGRTLQEAVAMQYGKDCVIPNLDMAGGGYGMPGEDESVPQTAAPEVIAAPLMFAFSTHGFRGIAGAPSSSEINAARKLRGQLESVSRFGKQYSNHSLMVNYKKNRDTLVESIEKGDYVSKMLIGSGNAALGLQASPDMAMLLEKFPGMATDPFEQKTALAFLAAKNGVSNAFSIAPSGSPLVTAEGSPNSPLAFDWSHVDHRGAQNAMWSYMLKNVDALIDLLKATDIDGDPTKGKMWDQSMIYIATEFGRDKIATGGSGHHLNNGNIMISPLLNGNKIYGGVNTQTGLTYGFNPTTGVPDTNTVMKEKHIYSAVTHAMGIDFKERIDMPAMVRKT